MKQHSFIYYPGHSCAEKKGFKQVFFRQKREKNPLRNSVGIKFAYNSSIKYSVLFISASALPAAGTLKKVSVNNIPVCFAGAGHSHSVSCVTIEEFN